MASPAGTKPLSRQERRNRERQKAQEQARKATKAGQTEDQQRRRVRDAAAQQDRSGGPRPGPRVDPRTMIDGMSSHLIDEPTTLSLTRHMGTLGLSADAAVGPLLHTLEAERDLIEAANDIGRQAVAKLPEYFSFFTKWRGRCVDMTAAAGVGDRDGSGRGKVVDKKMPLLLRTKDPQLLPGMKHCQLNLEATIEVWTVMLSRLEESLHHWQNRSMVPLENVVEDQVGINMRMDLESAKTRVMYSIQHMQAALQEATEIIEGVERGNGKGVVKTAVGPGQRQSLDKRLPEQGREAIRRPDEGTGRGRK